MLREIYHTTVKTTLSDKHYAEVYINPYEGEIDIPKGRESFEFRAFITHDSSKPSNFGDLYVWNGEDGVHEEVARELKLLNKMEVALYIKPLERSVDISFFSTHQPRILTGNDKQLFKQWFKNLKENPNIKNFCTDTHGFYFFYLPRELQQVIDEKIGGKRMSMPARFLDYVKEVTTPIYRSLSEIARDIRRNWKPVNFAARPYLDAMATLDKITDNYMADSGRSIVLYFLSNAGSWKGEVAKRIKLELKAMLAGKPVPQPKLANPAPTRPCEKCGAVNWIRVEGNPDEDTGWECGECGKDFEPDPVQKPVSFSRLPFSSRETISPYDV